MLENNEIKFSKTSIPDVISFELNPKQDERGFTIPLLPTFLSAHVLISINPRIGTLRGLHLQYEQEKIVSVIRGRIFDVVLDMRKDSSTYLKHAVFDILPGKNSIYIPSSCAHGFQTMEEDTEVIYQLSKPYNPNLESGVSWDDPKLGIKWPVVDSRIISDKDSSWRKL